MPRLFTALALPTAVAATLAEARGGLYGARWIDPSDYHVTLRFIGDIDARVADEVADALASVRRAPVAVAFEGLGWFGGDKPRAIVAKIKRSPALTELQPSTSAGCAASACRPRRAISRRMSRWRGCARLPNGGRRLSRRARRLRRRRRSRRPVSPCIPRATGSAAGPMSSKPTILCVEGGDDCRRSRIAAWRVAGVSCPAAGLGLARREEKVMGAMSDMDSDAARVVGEGTAPGLPQAGGLIAMPESVGDAERNPIFDALVAPNEEDVSGLVAYSIYKQNKRAWLDDFVKATGRAPSEAETRVLHHRRKHRAAPDRPIDASPTLTLTGETTPGRPSVRRSARERQLGDRRAVGAGDHRRFGGARPRDPRRLFQRRQIVSAPASAAAPRASARCRASARDARGRRGSRRTARASPTATPAPCGR